MRYDTNAGQVVLSIAELCHAAGIDPGEWHPIRAAGLEALPTVTPLKYTYEERTTGLVAPVGGVACRVEFLQIRRNDPDRTLVLAVDAHDGTAARRYAETALRIEATLIACFDGEAAPDTVRTELTVLDGDALKKSTVKDYRATDLRVWWMTFATEAAPSILMFAEHETSARAAFREARFPYDDCREGQALLMKECYRDILHGKRLFVQAPTGIGKTISTLYPAIRACGQGAVDRIFYLTAKASTRREAFSACSKLYAAGVPLRVITVTAKEQICPEKKKFDPATRTGSVCNPHDCARLAGYSERFLPAVRELLARQHGYDRKSISEVAERYRICPYELSLDMSEFCDVIVCDYNYVFDPSVSFIRYFSQEPGEARFAGQKYLFLIDEAHNLPDRARDMYSASLSLSQEQEVLSLFGTDLLPESADGALRVALAALDGYLVKLRRLCRDTLSRDAEGREIGFWMDKEPPSGLFDELTKYNEVIVNWLKGSREHPSAPFVYRLAVSLRTFLRLRDFYGDGFLTYVEVRGEDLFLRIFCLDPTHVVDERLRLASSSVLFSATLTPLEYFAGILGGHENTVQIALPSPFPRENLCLAAVDTVSTRYEDREKSCRRIVSCIAATVTAKTGNYIVYFPSYAYLDTVKEAFEKKYPQVRLVAQKPGMTHADREAFLDFFREDDERLRVGFCVLGGSFSEGVDLPGKRLIGVVIVGVGIPGLSNERNILRDHYQLKNEDGYNYAYTYPGMNRVLQAAGRVIRRDDDRGVVVLVDDRYATPLYEHLFPEHWSGIRFAGNASSLAEMLRSFWQNG